MAQAPGLIQLSWDPNPEPDVLGYLLYAGRASGVYTVAGSPTDVGNVITAFYRVNGVGPWFWTVTAYNFAGQISGFGNEITDIFVENLRPMRAFCA